MFAPSRDGIGNSSKNPSEKLYSAANSKKYIRYFMNAELSVVSEPAQSTQKMTKIFPKTKFEKGPARETVTVPKRGLRNLSERMFAGLAQPIKNIINAANPKGSMCLNGLKLNRLCILAVSSPNRYAASAYARS